MSFIGSSPSVKRTRFTPQAADPTNPSEGDLFYSNGTPRSEGLWIYSNGSWVKLRSGGFSYQEFTTPGANSFDVPAEVEVLQVLMTGGGGGGGGGGGNGAGAGGQGGGGGGGASLPIEAHPANPSAFDVQGCPG
jgi:hypothetical protein